MSLVSAKIKNMRKIRYINSLPESSVPIPETPPCICPKGSLTVEAALVLPFTAGFFAFLLFFFQIMLVQLTVQEALEDTGRALAIISEKEIEDTEEIPAYFTMAKASLFTKLSREESIRHYVAGEALGVSLLASDWEGDYLSLEANYAMKFPIELFGKRYVWLSQKASFRKWTGWHVTDVSNPAEIIVYVTAEGEIFHKRKSCPFLELTTRKVRASALRRLRNYKGEKYKECSLCRDITTDGKWVYITTYGNRYHYTITCSALKRTIYEKKLSEVGGKESCPKCWK